MTEIIQGPRHGCALGAQQTVVAIERAIPILHAGPGCGSKLHRGLSLAGGYQGAGYAGADAIPCTNMVEKDIVFGGVTVLLAGLRSRGCTPFYKGAASGFLFIKKVCI